MAITTSNSTSVKPNELANLPDRSFLFSMFSPCPDEAPRRVAMNKMNTADKT